MREPRKLDFDALHAYAARELGGRAYSLGDLREKLRKRAARLADVDLVLARLKELGALDDRQFAEFYAESRLRNQGHGRQRVLRDLRRRRVAPTVASRAVELAFGGTDETSLIEDYLARKYRHTDLGPLLSEPSKLASVYRRLRLAGFASGPVIGVLKRYAAAAGELETLDDTDSDHDFQPPSE